jgi:7-carboxy-7-deazaguanine synthase
MRISENFYSIQGEGELTGIPSVFVRTSGCNLRCRWCDTKYASWDPEGGDQTIDEIVAEVLSHGAHHTVVTGGEPMVAKGIHDLMSALRAAGQHLTIETAATVLPGGIACDLASLSPKLANSTPLPGEIAPGWIEKHNTLRLQPEVIRAWIEAYPYQLKFVVASAADLDEIEDLLRRIDREIPPHKVLLMPEGVTAAAIRGRDESLVDVCKDRGYRYCNRLHVEIFGNKRGT